MKKTLLSLVLAGLAGTAFAGQVYNYDSASSKASVDFNTEVGFNYSAHRVFFDEYGMAGPDEPVRAFDQRERQDLQVFTPSAKFTLSGVAQDLDTGFKFGFASDISSSYTYEKKRIFISNTPVSYLKDGVHALEKPVVNEIAFTFGSDSFGHFRVGKTSTAANTVFAADSAKINNSFLSIEDISIPRTANLAASKFSEVVVYEAPVWNGLSAAVSFAKEHQEKYVFTNQVAGNVQFNAYGAKVALTGYRNLFKADHHSIAVTKGLGLTAGYSMYDTDVTFGAGYEAKHQKQHPTDWSAESPRANDMQLEKAYSFGLEASYKGFQYAKPYFSAFYTKQVKKNFLRNFKVTNKSLGSTLGVASDLYKHDGVTVNLFAETGYARYSSKLEGRQSEKDNFLTFFKSGVETFYFGTGLNVSF